MLKKGIINLFLYLCHTIASSWRDSQFLLNRGEEHQVLLFQSSWIFARYKSTWSMIGGVLCSLILGHNNSWQQFAVYVERGLKDHLNYTHLQRLQEHLSGENLLTKYITQLAVRRLWLPVVRGGWFLFWHRGHLQSRPHYPRLVRPHIQ